MKALLSKEILTLHHFDNGMFKEGVHSGLTGDAVGLKGDVTCITGDASYIWGVASRLHGDVTGIMGCVTGVAGNLDDCEITPEERKAGISVSSLFYN